MAENKYIVGSRDDSDFTTWTAAELAEKIHAREISYSGGGGTRIA